MRERLTAIADGLERELKALGAWQAEPPSEEEVLAGGAFGMGTVPFEFWIQVVLIERLRQMAAGELDPPDSSMIAAHAVREWDGAPHREALLELLMELDELIEGES